MTPESWQRAKSIFGQAIEMPVSKRESFLEQTCAGDAELLAKVQELLKADTVETMLQSPVRPKLHEFIEADKTMTVAPGSSSAVPADTSVPATVGRYHVIRLIGEGGMGTVYEAEQEYPHRTVALKVIKPGMASPALLRRFEQEAEALGRLQHPGIAQIYDAGTAETSFGRQPYFAMEFIRGESLRDYVDRKHLNTRLRLELMAKVCDAVHHAHQRGLIHRDLKPGNILVDETGQPKILDFGVARLTDRDSHATSQTDVGQLIGTLAYMSPEQVLADPLELDTRSDVYALGVILYELLAARLPYNIGNKLHEALHAIQEEDPARLSSVNRGYKGDVETIVAKALEKDKSRRYSSAAELAADIRRFLTDEPIVARPPSVTYQLQKFARRHKALVAGLAAVFVVLIAGVAVSTMQAARANRERDRASAAERRANEARDQANLSRDQALQAEQQATADRNKAVAAEAQARQARDKAVAEKQRADTETAAEKALNEFLGKDLLGMANPMAQSSTNLQTAAPTGQGGRRDAAPTAELTVKEALDRASKKIEGRFPNQPLVEASIRESLSQTYLGLGVLAEAHAQQQQAVDLRTRVQGKQHLDTLTARSQLAYIRIQQGVFRDAEAALPPLIEDERKSLGEAHKLTQTAISGLLVSYIRDHNYAQAESFLKNDVIAYDRRVLGEDNFTTIQSESLLINLYKQWQPQPRLADAEAFAKSLLQQQERILGPENSATRSTIEQIAEIEINQGHFQQGVDLLAPIVSDQLIDKAIAAGKAGVDKYPYVADMVVGLGMSYARLGKTEQAKALLDRLPPLFDLLLAKSTGVANLASPAITMAGLTVVYLQAGLDRELDDLLPRVLDLYRQNVASTDQTGVALRNIFTALPQLYAAKKKYSQAEKLYRDVLQINRSILGDEDAATLRTATALAAHYGNYGITLDSYESAEQLIAHFLEIERRKLGENYVGTRTTLAGLADIYRNHARSDMLQGRTAQAASELAKAEELARQLAALLASLPPGAFEGGAGTPGGVETGNNMFRLTAILAAQGKYSESEAEITRLIDAVRHPGMEVTVNQSLVILGWLKIHEQKFAEAEAALKDACPFLADPRHGVSQNLQAYSCQAELAASMIGQRRFPEAEPILLRSDSDLVRIEPDLLPAQGDDLFTARESEEWTVRMYQEWGKPDQAAEWKTKVQAAKRP
jgi:non-specific serine/threonine protein kinase/serine/threonine-protein kinase